MKPGGIYQLRCPITKQVRYIGQAKSFSNRRREYMKCRGSNQSVTQWLLALKSNGQKPLFEPILITDDVHKKDLAERRLIAVYGDSLLNIRTGGRSMSWTVPHLESQEAEKRSQAMRDWWAKRRSRNNQVNHSN